MKQLTSFFVLFILLFTGCNNGQASNDGLDWQTNLESALQKAKTENQLCHDTPKKALKCYVNNN